MLHVCNLSYGVPSVIILQEAFEKNKFNQFQYAFRGPDGRFEVRKDFNDASNGKSKSALVNVGAHAILRFSPMVSRNTIGSNNPTVP